MTQDAQTGGTALARCVACSTQTFADEHWGEYMRGDAGEWNAAQVPMGRAVAAICDAIEIPHTSPSTADDVAATVALVGRTAFATRRPGACLLPRRLTVPVTA